MWLFTPTTFLSVVADREHPGDLLVRARTRADVHVFADATAAPAPTQRFDRDYRWRTHVPADTFATWVAGQARAIDYGNFKDTVAERHGPQRARAYGEIWRVMYDVQREADAGDERDRREVTR